MTEETTHLRVVRPSDEHQQDGVKPRPPVLRALGKLEPPAEVEVGGSRYLRVEVLKHDSWAATAVYEGSQERIVCKFNRQQSIFGVPAAWIGRRLAARESYLLKALAALPNVPAYRGPVLSNGRPLRHCTAHVYVPGHPLKRREYVNDEFFPTLGRMLDSMHRLGIVYVDLHKSENILVGDDGQPHLIDFQVCFIRPRRRWLSALLQYVEAVLKDTDRYHFRKHLCRSRPDLAGCDCNNERPWLIRAHRSVAAPLRTLRRRLLVAIGVRRGLGLADSEHFPEDAVRRAQDDSPRKASPKIDYSRESSSRRVA